MTRSFRKTRLRALRAYAEWQQRDHKFRTSFACDGDGYYETLLWQRNWAQRHFVKLCLNLQQGG